jgi:phosphopantetheinyl transferase
MNTFKIGLSLKTPDHNLHDEGRRVLTALDNRSSAILIEPSGRPYFQDRHADFSISHSRSLAAVSYTVPPYHTGCDIQYVNPKHDYDAVSRRFFAVPEREYIDAAADSFEKSKRFCQIWTLKECFLKLHGLTIGAIKEAPAFTITNNGRKAYQAYSKDTNTIDFFLLELENEPDGRYILAAAREPAGPATEDLPPPALLWV